MKKALIEKIGSTKFARKKFVKKKVDEYKAEQKLIQSLLINLKKQCFDSLHNCSIFIWWEIREKGDLTLLLKEKREVSPLELKGLSEIYTGLQDEYIKTIGWSDEQIKIFELKSEIIERQNKILPPECDNTQYTWIDIAEEKLKGLEKHTESSNLFTLTAALEETLHTQIDPYTCSVIKFNGYVQRAKEKQEN